MDRNGQRIPLEYASRILPYDKRDFPHLVFEYPGRQVIRDAAFRDRYLEGTDESEIVETGIGNSAEQPDWRWKYGLFDVDGQPFTPEL